MKTGASDKKTGLIENFCRVDPKKGSTRRVKKISPIPREINEFSFQGILQPITPRRPRRCWMQVCCAVGDMFTDGL